MIADAPTPRDVLRHRLRNTTFRRSLNVGSVLFTKSVADFPLTTQVFILKAIQEYSDFGPDDLEHDYGVFEYQGMKLFWKIDDLSLYGGRLTLTVGMTSEW